nr:PfkB family carbohydrate kinase [Streptomyces sp. AC555_RSS877]
MAEFAAPPRGFPDPLTHARVTWRGACTHDLRPRAREHGHGPRRARRQASRRETVIGRGFRPVPGGQGANQAVAAARVGGTASMIGVVGADVFGTRLRAARDRRGLDRRR